MQKVMTIYDNVVPEWTTEHRGKMSGMVSLSTSPILNKTCQKRHKVGASVCSKCFSLRHTAFKHELADKLERNHYVLTNRVIPVEEWPIVPNYIARFESFGELNNVTQLHNYFNCCKANPNTTFTLWTKNIYILSGAQAQGLEKPDNLIIVQSSLLLNKQVKPQHEWADKVFTVYTSDYISENNVPINCGDKQCIVCKMCYTKKNNVEYINEKVK